MASNNGWIGSVDVLLHRNASLPWFILVPDTEITDLLDLPAAERDTVTEECARVSRFLKQELGFAKVNFAGLGNQVPQLHLHVIGRSPDDACWPNPVWGNLVEESAYDSERLAEWQGQLAANYGLQVSEL